MSTYIKLSTLEYPRYEGDIRLEHSEIREDQTWPDFPCPDTYALVTSVEIPVFNPETQCVNEVPPAQIEGVWTQQFIVRIPSVTSLLAGFAFSPFLTNSSIVFGSATASGTAAPYTWTFNAASTADLTRSFSLEYAWADGGCCFYHEPC